MSQRRVHSKIIYKGDDGANKVFLCHEKLGNGGFAVVRRVTEQSTKKVYAMKIISKKRHLASKSKLFMKEIENEIQIQKKLNHLNIVRSKMSFSDDQNQYILLEYCPGKSVWDYLNKSKNGRLNESETRKILKDVIQGLVYLHDQNIIHHDLKLENFLIGADGKVKIADFGLSTLLESKYDKICSYCGTPCYMSPEIIENENHGFEIDIWAIGVCAFIMLTGEQPFGKEGICEQIKKCDYCFPFGIQLSYEARDFIMSILRIDPERRPKAKDLLNHPFLKKKDHSKQIPNPIPNRKNQSNNCFDGVQILDENENPLKILDKNYLNHIQQENCQIDINTKKISDTSKPYITKFGFCNEGMGYLLRNGIVGVCFNDCSRMVMDPNEEFIQYYKYYNSNKEVIDLDDSLDQDQKIKLQSKIALVKKFSRRFKKNKYLYKLENEIYDLYNPLYNVKYFVKKNDAILFQMSTKDIQVDFIDQRKLIIFWNIKKMCLFKGVDEKFNLINLKDMTAMDPNCEENIKYKVAKELLMSLSAKM